MPNIINVRNIYDKKTDGMISPNLHQFFYSLNNFNASYVSYFLTDFSTSTLLTLFGLLGNHPLLTLSSCSIIS